jgi:hypothetical protein
MAVVRSLLLVSIRLNNSLRLVRRKANRLLEGHAANVYLLPYSMRLSPLRMPMQKNGEYIINFASERML